MGNYRLRGIVSPNECGITRSCIIGGSGRRSEAVRMRVAMRTIRTRILACKCTVSDVVTATGDVITINIERSCYRLPRVKVFAKPAPGAISKPLCLWFCSSNR